MPSVTIMRQALIDAYNSGYVTFAEAAPIADYIADLWHVETNAISF